MGHEMRPPPIHASPEKSLSALFQVIGAFSQPCLHGSLSCSPTMCPNIRRMKGQLVGGVCAPKVCEVVADTDTHTSKYGRGCLWAHGVLRN